MKFRDNVPDGAGAFLKIKDGESVTGCFAGDIHDYSVIWQGGKSEVVRDGTPGSKFRFRINFVVKENDIYTAKIFEQGATVYKRLKSLHADMGLDQIVVKITRHGSTKNDTEYIIDPVWGKDRKLMAVPSQIAVVKLQDVKSDGQGIPPIDSNDFGPSREASFGQIDDSEIPF